MASNSAMVRAGCGPLVSPPWRVLQHVRSARCRPRWPAGRAARVVLRAAPGSSAYGGAAGVLPRRFTDGDIALNHSRAADLRGRRLGADQDKGCADLGIVRMRACGPEPQWA